MNNTTGSKMENPPDIGLNDPMLGLLGLSRRAGQFCGGFTAVADLLQKNRLSIVLIDSALGRHTREKILGKASQRRVQLFVVDGEALNKWCGYRVVGLLSGELANRFEEMIKQEYQWH